eukprot:1161392-Pelagomonas_calceolata.AAC.27
MITVPLNFLCPHQTNTLWSTRRERQTQAPKCRPPGGRFAHFSWAPCNHNQAHIQWCTHHELRQAQALKRRPPGGHLVQHAA